MKIQRFLTWPLAITLAGVVGLAGFIIVALAPQTAEAVRTFPKVDMQCVDKTVSPGLVVAGDPDTLTYVVTVRNNSSTRTANGVVVTDTLPPEIPATATFVSATPTAGTCDAPAGGILTCNLGNLGPSAVETVTIVINVTAAEGDTFKNIAEVSTTSTESNTGNNGGPGSACEQSVVVRVVGTPNLVCLNKTAEPTTVELGVPTDILYTVTIQNTGDATATNVSVKDTLTLSKDVTFVSSNIGDDCGLTAGDTLSSGSMITCDLADIDMGQQGVVQITVNIADPMAGNTFANAAVASADVIGDSDICDVTVTVDEPPGDNACTPGFWRNHTELWPSPANPGDDFGAEFGVSLPFGNVNSTKTLDEAVHLGGGNCKKLLRHGTAAYLNALFGGFSLDVGEVTQKIQDAFAGSGNCQPEANEFGVLNDNKICLVD